MTSEEPRVPVLACIVDAIPEAERAEHFALLVHLFGTAAQETRELPNGFAFRFESETFDQVTRFVSGERRCCPFLTFKIALAPSNGSLWLHMTGPEGTREFLAAELPNVSPRSN